VSVSTFGPLWCLAGDKPVMQEEKI